jgi:hypothetical protein
MFLGFLKGHFLARLCFEHAPAGTDQDVFGEGGDEGEGDADGDGEPEAETEDEAAIAEVDDDGAAAESQSTQPGVGQSLFQEPQPLSRIFKQLD